MATVGRGRVPDILCFFLIVVLLFTSLAQCGQQLFDAANENNVMKVAELLKKPNIDINFKNAVRDTMTIELG
jgi:hypothetical protein